MAGDGGGCKTSSLRWPCLARCTAALVVTVLAAVILVKAVFLILHPNKFQLKVSGKFLVQKWTDTNFTCRFYLQAENHREHAFMYYRDVTVRLIDGKAPSRTIMNFSLSETITLMQGQVQQYYLVEDYDQPLNKNDTDALAKKEGIGGSTVELDGVLTNGGDMYRASYSCAPVTIVDGNDIKSLPSPSGNDAARCIPTVFL